MTAGAKRLLLWSPLVLVLAVAVTRLFRPACGQAPYVP